MLFARRVSAIAAITLPGVFLPAQGGIAAAPSSPVGQVEALPDGAGDVRPQDRVGERRRRRRWRRVLSAWPAIPTPHRRYVSDPAGQYEDVGRPATLSGVTAPWNTQKFAQLGRAIDQ
jgi:hypothetical protein